APPARPGERSGRRRPWAAPRLVPAPAGTDRPANGVPDRAPSWRRRHNAWQPRGMAELRQFTLSAFFGFRGRPMRVITEVPKDATTREHWFAESGLEASLTTEELRMLRRERYLYDPQTNTIHLDLETATGRLVLDEAGRPVIEAERDAETGELRSLRFHLPQPEGVELTVGPEEAAPGSVDMSALKSDHR